MARKRSLKDAAIDHLVEKEGNGPAASRTPARKTATRRRTAKSPEAASLKQGVRHRVPGEGRAKPLDQRRKTPSSFVRVALSILIGFVGGCFLGRFIKIV